MVGTELQRRQVSGLLALVTASIGHSQEPSQPAPPPETFVEWVGW